jgi:radical SAM protein with 4Fe4S-binding SPASM domain
MAHLRINSQQKPNSIFMFHIDIVHGCQLQCIGCPNATLLDKVKRVDVQHFSKILANVDVEHIHTLRLFNFGEPLLHRQLDKIVAEIPKQKWKASFVELSTNAQYVDWKNFEEMLKLQVVNKIAVSCDGDGSKEKYERLRPPAQMEKLMYFLEKTKELCEKWSPATELITRTIIETEQDKQNWLDILTPLGWTPEFRKWMILPESKENPSNRQLQSVKGSCFFMADASAFKSHSWHGQINLLYVDYDGTVVPCCFHPKAGVFGNLSEQKFSEILSSQQRLDFKNSMDTARETLPICSQCEVGPVGNEGPSFLA